MRRADNECHVLATQGVDPRTGRPFDNPEALLGVTLERTVLAPTEGVLDFVDGALDGEAHPAVVVRPEDDPALVAHVTPLTRGAEVRLGGVTTGQREYRSMVAPVEYRATGRTGALLRVVLEGCVGEQGRSHADGGADGQHEDDEHDVQPGHALSEPAADEHRRTRR